MIEEFLDLRIAHILFGEEAPGDAHIVRVENPTPEEVDEGLRDGWYHKPCYVTYVLPVPASMEEYIEWAFRSRNRNKPRRLLREVPKRYRLVVEENGRNLPEFTDLYRRTIVERPRGKDRLGEHDGEVGLTWLGYYLFEDKKMIAGILVHTLPRHLSIAYGAFDLDHRALDLEHFLIMQVLQRCIDEKQMILSLGMDTNRYGHHLSLSLPAYKLRVGFTPMPFEPAGRELLKIQRFDIFEKGLFFYSYADGELVGNYFSRGEPDLRPFQHQTTPPIRTILIPQDG